MVGASELPFRLLCRKYGAQSCYTPMIAAEAFAAGAANDPVAEHRYLFPAIRTYDHPLICHVAANDPAHFAAAAVRAAQIGADGIDLNLGCPQRTAYVGHFGSYLLDETDLLGVMVRAAVEAAPTTLPVSVKLRLLPTLPETVLLCRRLCDAGVAAIAIHARYRASWERTAAGARDGPAHLDQVTAVKVALSHDYPHVRILANGNTIDWDDVQTNLHDTHADGLMSAEGILDNPALFLPRYGRRSERRKPITVWSLKQQQQNHPAATSMANENQQQQQQREKKIRKLQKRLTEIEDLEQQTISGTTGEESASLSLRLTADQRKLLESKSKRMRKLQTLLDHPMEQVTVTLGSLYDAAEDKLQLAVEYLDLATVFPVAMRTVTFHVRRMLKETLVRYQLLDECVSCATVAQVRTVLRKVEQYQNDPATFVHDRLRAQHDKDALDRQQREEGKRQAYVARMMRKAKREGRTDVHHYLHQGADLPTADELAQFQTLSRDQVMAVWKERHSQHCLSFHFDGGCPRGRACAFLHVTAAAAAAGNNSFVETEECAG